VAWVVIVLIFIVAFGPLLWLMPSRRERRLAALRQRAYQAGLRVEMGRVPRADPAPEQRVTAGGRPMDLSRETAIYLHPLARRLRVLPSARLLRGEHGLPARPGWSFEAGARPDDAHLRDVLDAVGPLLERLPADVVAVAWRPHEVAVYWLESPGSTVDSVAVLGAWLAGAATELSDLDTRLQVATPPGKI
jgi:hypothetical protein